MKRVLFRPEAEADLLSIAVHIAQDSTDRARSFVARLRERCNQLSAHPLMGRPRDDLSDGMRSIIERPYVLIYRVLDDTVEIVAILHGARDLPAALATRIEHDDP